MADPQEFDFKIYQAATLEISKVFLDNAGDPVDLTGFTAALNMRKQYDCDGTLYTYTEDDALTLDDDGTVTIALDPTETTDLEPGRYVYDLMLTSDEEVATLFLRGYIDVIARAAYDCE